MNLIARKLVGLLDVVAEHAVDRAARIRYKEEINIGRRLAIKAAEESTEYAAEHMRGAVWFNSRNPFLQACVRAVARRPGDVLEFGVWEGKSINIIAAETKAAIFGFDSFEGLPEDWKGHQVQAGGFSTGGKLPTVPAHVSFYKGWFKDTIPQYMRDRNEPISFMYIDCDLYSSTKTVLELLADRITAGTVIGFDEYYNYPNWREGEFKAFREFIDATGRSYEYMFFSDREVAVRIQ